VPEHSPNNVRAGAFNRRDFLRGSALSLAAVSALPSIIPASALGKEKKAAPSEKVVVGLIGCGDLGRRHHLAGCLLPNPRIEVAAVCDVDANRRDDAAKMIFEKTKKRVRVFEDFRQLLQCKDLDAVLIATCDHWHAMTAIAAMEAGKDVYCEKPLSLTIEEAQMMAATARRYGAVFQTGSQQRSDGRFRQACELVRNKKIGKIKRVDTVLHAIDAGQWVPPQTPPQELNWNFWLGQTPYVDYYPNRVHYQFRWFYDYSGGVMTDWGAHHNDIAQWALGTDGSGPVEVDGTKASFSDVGPHTVPQHFAVDYKYADGVALTCRTDNFKDSDGEFGNGVKFTGENGWIFVSRGEIKASDPEILKTKFGPSDVLLYKSENHHNNWLDCIASRERCICDVEIGASSVIMCHIGNISMRLGRALKWDPAKQQFVGDAAANAMLSRPVRGSWRL
jgi:predicted dehydrogenase